MESTEQGGDVRHEHKPSLMHGDKSLEPALPQTATPLPPTGAPSLHLMTPMAMAPAQAPVTTKLPVAAMPPAPQMPPAMAHTGRLAPPGQPPAVISAPGMLSAHSMPGCAPGMMATEQPLMAPQQGPLPGGLPMGPASQPPNPGPAPYRQLKVEDALAYLDQVKMKFEKQPHIYNQVRKRIAVPCVTTSPCRPRWPHRLIRCRICTASFSRVSPLHPSVRLTHPCSEQLVALCTSPATHHAVPPCHRLCSSSTL